MPWIACPTDASKSLTLNDLDVTRFWRQPRMNAFLVTHLCPELQIRAGEPLQSISRERAMPSAHGVWQLRSHVAATVLFRPPATAISAESNDGSSAMSCF